MSSGLTYTPGMYADTGELAALCEVVAEFGGFYAPHTRSYGAGALEAYAEMIDLARTTGCALHLTHATMNFGVNRGRAPEFLDMVDAGLADGCDITLDTYPYLPGATTLSALLPSWAMSGRPGCGAGASAGSGGPRANHPGRQRERLRRLPRRHRGMGHHPDQRSRQPRPRPSTSEGRSTRSRRTADLRRWRCSSTCCSATAWPPRSCSMSATRRTFAQSWCTPSTWVAATPFWSASRPHPRAWGTFPRYLGHYVREVGLLSLEDCVNHLTGRAAQRLRLADRGFVRTGYAADLVLVRSGHHHRHRDLRRIPNSRRAGSATSSSTANAPSTTAGPPDDSPAAPSGWTPPESRRYDTPSRHGNHRGGPGARRRPCARDSRPGRSRQCPGTVGHTRTSSSLSPHPDVLEYLRAAAASRAVLGVGTVLTADQARAAIDAGAQIPCHTGDSGRRREGRRGQPRSR